ncbi:MAG: cytochrome b/b6 domain-containing protein [Campylobacterota bacterium]|nr:cytochrome b/b6 domain-containing protein [Campylobacterota bacterium]
MNKNKNQKKVYVWPLCTRLVHWFIAFSFTTALILSFFENKLNYHVAMGIIFGLMLLYRIIWGFIGPRYATFNTFKLSFSQLKHYFVEKIENRYRPISAGHNAASSWYTLIVLFVGSIIVFSGLLLYGIQESKGYLSVLNDEYYLYSDFVLTIHIYATWILVFWAIVHIAGVLVEQFYHKTNMVDAMVSGYKKTSGEDTQLCTPKNVVSYIILGLSIFVFFIIIDGRHNPFVKNKFSYIDYKLENQIFYDNCSECHKIYPTYMLPEKSWTRIMDGLDNHFGEEISDQNISKNDQTIIRKYLLENSAQSSKREAAVKIMKYDGNSRPLAITKTKYWRQTHKNIPNHIYNQKNIKDKSNCFACHKNLDKGMIEDIDIIIH